MLRDYKEETKKRVEFIRDFWLQSGTTGIIFANSGGKDCALAGILCKMACDNTIGIMLPCESSVNFGSDMEDGRALAEQFNIQSHVIDLTELKRLAVKLIGEDFDLAPGAIANIAPRLRMLTLFTIANSKNMLVVGTGNRSEIHLGYFTKWGDGAYDFNPISDLTVREVYEFLAYLDAPKNILTKAPTAGLFEGQTDEGDMGITYDSIDDYLLYGKATEEVKRIVDGYHARTEHKRQRPRYYKD